MKLKTVFSINFPIAILFGLTSSLFPVFGLRLYGLPPDAASIWVSRLVGGSILGYATLMWFGRRTESRAARRAVALALLVQDVIGFAASLEIQLRGIRNALGWMDPVIYGGLALAYAYGLSHRAEQ